jgi:host factor-I protein
MNKSSGNLQDLFLNYVRKENIPVTIYLVNSVQLRGAVRGFDPFTILLETPGRPMQMVYKSAVTSIVPMRAVYMRGADTSPRGDDNNEGEHESPPESVADAPSGDPA